MTTTITVLDDFAPLFEPNHTAAERAKYDNPVYREKLTNRLLDGENVPLTEFGVKEYDLYSGRSSGKTTQDEIAAALDIVQGCGDMWYCRSEDGDIRNTIFTSMQAAIRQCGFGISSRDASADFRVSYSPFTITHNATGNRIQFFGINKDINRSKGFYPPSGRLKRVMIEEANEPDDGIYIDALRSTATRFFTSESKIVYRRNPALTRQHWSVDYFDKRVRLYGAIRIYTTWKQLARIGLLSPATVADIMQMETADPEFYKYWYLGQMISLTGMVFRHFDRDKHIVSIPDVDELMNQTSRVIVSGDAANKNDPTCFGCLLVLMDGRLLVLDALYYDPRIHGAEDDLEMARKICAWWRGVLAKYPRLRQKQMWGTVDNANWSIMRLLSKSNDMGYIDWYAATDKNITRDTNRLQGVISENLLYFYEASDNDVKQITRELDNYCYDPKTQDIKKGQDDHGIDMLKYGTVEYTNRDILF